MDKQQTVLAFIDWYRPGYKAGGTVTSFGNFVDHLEPYFNFKIITRNTDFLEVKAYPNITPNSWNSIGGSLCYYLSHSKVSYSEIKKLIVSTPYDIIYINGVFSLYFSIIPLWLSRRRSCIMNPHGMLSDQAFSVKSLKKKIFLSLANVFGLFKNVVFHVSNEDEAQAVKKRIKAFKSIKIANQFPRQLKQNFQEKSNKHEPVRFVNVARVSIEKGTLIMLSALKFIEQPLVLDLYGPIYDEGYWVLCEAAISDLPKHIHVSYKGFLESEKIPEILSEYDFFVLLSEGENFGHAILEALSAGLPVLISDKTPWKDLESKCVGWDLALKDQSAIIRCFTIAITMSDETYSKWSQAAFDYAKAFVDDPGVLEMNRRLFLAHLPSSQREETEVDK